MHIPERLKNQRQGSNDEVAVRQYPFQLLPITVLILPLPLHGGAIRVHLNGAGGDVHHDIAVPCKELEFRGIGTCWNMHVYHAQR